MKEMYRQGDVLFVKIRRAPKGERKPRANGHILEGEATGHVHRVCESDLATGEVYEIGDRLFLSAAAEGISIVHDEHAPIALPPGDYEVVRQREYSPEEIRNVAD
jgi:hypothetical protein